MTPPTLETARVGADAVVVGLARERVRVAADLLALTKEGPAGTKAYASSRLALTEWEEHDLQRYFDVTKAEMAFAKGVILVEGIAEQFLIPAFASNLRLNGTDPLELDRVGISVCAVYGTDFLPYVKLLSPDGLNIPFVLISDGDVTFSDGSAVYAGLKRAIKFLPDTQKQAAETLRLADHIFIEELRRAGWYDKTSQAFAVFLPVKSVGVAGDGRRHDPVVALRAVETVDFMTARWAHLPYELLDVCARRIVNEVPGISRVVYDISGKPPATIEWD